MKDFKPLFNFPKQEFKPFFPKQEFEPLLPEILKQIKNYKEIRHIILKGTK